MKNKLDFYTDNELIEILNNSRSFREALNELGYCGNGSGGYTSAKRILKRRNIDIPKYNTIHNGANNTKYSLDDILVENSDYTSRARLKIRLVNEGLLEYKCSKCGNTGEWKGKPLALQLEHKNGINNDNRIENLEFLCPNCHSQTKTFAGKNRSSKKESNYCSCGVKIHKTSKMCPTCRAIKNRKIVNRPDKEVLLNDVSLLGYRGTGRKYGVSDNTIRMWLK